MTASEILGHIRNLPENNRREVVQQILDEFTEFDDELTPEQIAELDRRAEDALKNPARGKTLEEVHEEMKTKHGWRRENHSCSNNPTE